MGHAKLCRLGGQGRQWLYSSFWGGGGDGQDVNATAAHVLKSRSVRWGVMSVNGDFKVVITYCATALQAMALVLPRFWLCLRMIYQ